MILALLMPPCSLAQLCPTNCKFCSTGLADCEDISSLVLVLSGIPTSIDKILLRGGPVTHFPTGAFRNFSHLKVLSINNFPISTMMNYSFDLGQSNHLKELDLSKNRLTSCGIEAASFADLMNLTSFTLSNNALNTLRKPWFQSMVSLENLQLENNGITYLQPRLFENLLHLKKLNLSSNLISYVSTDTFFGLRNLIELDLADNKVMSISDDAFSPLRNIEGIALFHNNLKVLPTLPASTSTLQLHSNPWLCSCVLVSTLTVLRERVMLPASVVCASPAEVKGRQVLDVYNFVCKTNTTDSGYPNSGSETQQSCQSWVYGLIGGFVLAVFLLLLICLLRKHCRQGSVTDPLSDRKEGDGSACRGQAAVLQETYAAVAALTHMPPSAAHGYTRDTGLQAQTELDCLGGEKEEQSTGREDQIRLCRTAPGFLTAVDELHQVTSGEEMSNAETSGMKYFETEFANLCDGPNICFPNPGLQFTEHTESHKQDTGKYRMRKVSGKRSKSLNNLSLNKRDSSFEVEHSTRLCHFELNYSSAPKNDTLTDTKVTRDQFKVKDQCNANTAGLKLWERCMESNENLFPKVDYTQQSSNSVYSDGVSKGCLGLIQPHCIEVAEDDGYVKLGASSSSSSPCSPSLNKASNTAESKQGSRLSRTETEGVLLSKPHRNGLCKSPALSATKGNLQSTRVSRKGEKQAKPGKRNLAVSWTGAVLTRERFWKYHQNCCDEYRPCPSARTVLQRLPRPSCPRAAGEASISRPPGDSELLKNNRMLTVNLLLQLQEREERKRSRMNLK
ncbi:uncharacterized protein LOC136758557 [Amia ocellicauda]|uniref:uncharacterized protein LOC136758557 n=1 Tax=Amia ocellicauda TaxID=2972642 RepID=UPI0034639A9D